MYIVYEGACGVCCTAQYCSFYQVQGFFPMNLSWIVSGPEISLPVLVLILHMISQRKSVKGNLQASQVCLVFPTSTTSFCDLSTESLVRNLESGVYVNHG